MEKLSDEQFEDFVNEGFKAIPPLYMKHLNNLAIVIEDEPSIEQRERLKLRCGQTLYGLYEGIPLTKRGVGSNPNLAPPDKITIFKLPIISNSQSLKEVEEQVRKTLWHEIAHFYGLDHDKIHKLEKI
jgi:predicted Zn-dependent protease with MMP-like domain